ncbi:MAG: M20/M25/M40 family metallo-hydrolase [Acidobacteria bacterium]|nr:M20/M25/M40 family metallo-hydrolase [Acidobacteriota bacterium]
MRRCVRCARVLLCAVVAGTTVGAQAPHERTPAGRASWLEPYREPAARLIGEAVSNAFAWQRLAVLTDTIGNRLSGTPALDRAIQWAVDEMKRDGLENVRAEKVMVPRWVRGSESAEIVEPARHQIVMLGLGDSVATPPDGVQAEVLIVRSFEELDAKSTLARGRIVLFNVAYTNYGETARFRSSGPSRAARDGAVAALVRAVGPPGLRTPHTGALQYATDAPKIPAAAITTEDADRLQRIADRGSKIVVRLKMEAHFDADVESANVVGEIRGREKPDEIVVVSGHLDSWDVGAGATDDGGGCIVTWEALRLMKKLNLRPRRTVRVVLWTNEENGGRGGLGYRDQHRGELAKHVLMLESDGGVFRPLGFGFTGNDRAFDRVKTIATLLSGIAADQIVPGGGGADIGPSVQEGHMPSMSLDVEGSKYFVIHHTPADTVDKIDPVEMAKCAAAVAVMAYVVADLPERLGQ